ncbi:hypothetical protein PRZ48_004210 [Zasmidium cellare]|uniref:DUF6590 domain-containing protein n=1 Tax=Zasmidium cellare TaxID=395010 RepID=A0ABR0EYG2_ZASCE|nr:hypothetical protein PRZ48_004210 [Zasmidium cellare]
MAADLISKGEERLQHMGSWIEHPPSQPSSTWCANDHQPRPDPKPLYQCNIIKPQKHTFFRLGRVFRFPWSETAGTTAFGTHYKADEFVKGRENGTHIYQKNRIFVVIREGQESCSVLLITTYGNQGVAKPSVDKSQHGLIYTGTEPTVTTYQESRRPGVLQEHAIRVVGDQPTCILDTMSRINYAQVHTVHHNVEVESIGMVHPGSIPHLLLQFINVWVSPLMSQSHSFPLALLTASTHDPPWAPSSTPEDLTKRYEVPQHHLNVLSEKDRLNWILTPRTRAQQVPIVALFSIVVVVRPDILDLITAMIVIDQTTVTEVDRSALLLFAMW